MWPLWFLDNKRWWWWWCLVRQWVFISIQICVPFAIILVGSSSTLGRRNPKKKKFQYHIKFDRFQEYEDNFVLKKMPKTN